MYTSGELGRVASYFLTAVLQVSHQRLLDSIELGELYIDSLARPL